jgi:hypothetical protein
LPVNRQTDVPLQLPPKLVFLQTNRQPKRDLLWSVHSASRNCSRKPTTTSFLYERTKQNQPALIGGRGMGLIEATAPRVLATEQSVQQAPPPSEESDVAKAVSDKLQDPTSKYPKSPSKGNRNPGLA